jgi:hypothetical protein
MGGCGKAAIKALVAAASDAKAEVRCEALLSLYLSARNARQTAAAMKAARKDEDFLVRHVACELIRRTGQ